ncbi:sphingomyelin phosphodiesterase [Ciona intestinalis]
MKYLLLATLVVLYLAALAETSVVNRKLRVQQFEKDSDVTEDYELKRKVGLLFLRKILGQGDILRPEKEKELDRLVEQSGMTCTLCKAGVDVIQKLLHSNGGEDVITAIAVEVCELGNIEDRRVCKLAVEEFKQEVFYVLFNLQPDELCYWLLKSQCRKPADFLPNWVVTSSATPQPPYKPRVNPANGTPTLKFLFFTDMHMDVRYAPGRTAKCREPLCCRDNDALPDQESDAAGMWGDYRHCDMPQNTVESMMSQVANYDDIDFIIFTGDIPAHNVWNQTKEDQIDKLRRWTDLLKKHFPTTPVYAAVGNHESAPVNSYPPHSIYDQPGADTQWLLDTLYDSWSNWIPEADMGFVKQGAFYTTLIRPGLRVVSLNTNYCSDDSWWLLVGSNAVDPEGQLKWFAGVMQAAEDNDENVLIISHRPTDGCMKPWSDNYYDIINRYQNVIIAQLFGHAHTDEMMLYYDITQEDRVSAVGLIGPGFTTYSNLNSGYRVYTMEGEYEGSRYSLLDGESYYLNITDANIKGVATWQREYSFVKDYDVINLTPPELKKLVDRFDSDEQLFQSYHNHITKMEDLSDCDVTCKQSTLCHIKTFRADDDSFC